jgi:outer membrane receptor protein involved in Fe transport
VQAAILNALRANLPATLFPLLSNLPNGQPIVALASYMNFGKVDTQGADIALNYYVSDRWLVDASYSWFDFDVKQQAVGDQLLPNSPENKVNLGLTFTGEKTAASVKYRWVDGFPWAAGIFVGEVPSYNVVDLSASYRLTPNWELGVDVSNLLDEKHWQSWGGDLLKRRALGHVTFSW